jgi:cell division septation protein DedD
MKKIDSKGKSSIRYIGRGVIIVSLITTSSLAFLLGFFVGKNAQPPAVNQAPVVAPVAAPENADSLKQEGTATQGSQQPPETQQNVQPDVQSPQPAQETPEPLRTEPANESAQMKESDRDLASQETAGAKKYTVQAGAFKNASEANILKVKLRKKGYKASLSPIGAKKQEKLYRVLVGEFSRKSEAELLAVRIKKTEGLPAFVIIGNQEALRSQ